MIILIASLNSNVTMSGQEDVILSSGKTWGKEKWEAKVKEKIVVELIERFI